MIELIRIGGDSIFVNENAFIAITVVVGIAIILFISLKYGG